MVVPRQLDTGYWFGLCHSFGDFRKAGSQQYGCCAPLQCSADHSYHSLPLYSFATVRNTHRSVLHVTVFATLFRGLTYCPRYGSVFRADCDRRILFSGLGEGTHELRISGVTSCGALGLGLRRVHVLEGYPHS